MTTNQTITAAEAKVEFSELLSRVSHHKERIIITRRGKEIAAIIPVEDLQLIKESLNKIDLQEAVESLKQSRESGTITLDQLKKETGK